MLGVVKTSFELYAHKVKAPREVLLGQAVVYYAVCYPNEVVDETTIVSGELNYT
jgi:hypothetical protein